MLYMGKARVNLRLDAELWASVQARAKVQRRTLTSFVEEGLEDLLRESEPLSPGESELLKRVYESPALERQFAEPAPESSSRRYRCRCPKDWGDSVMCPDCGYRAR